MIYGYALTDGQVTDNSVTYTDPTLLGFNRSACFAFQPEQSAACDQSEKTSHSELITTSTSANNYPRPCTTNSPDGPSPSCPMTRGSIWRV